jgi:hypothetical protein
MEHPLPDAFTAKQAAAFGPAEAIDAARRAMKATGHPEIDGVAACEVGTDGLWRVEVEVIECHARMGDNDLLAAYDVRLGARGELQGFRRLRRYYREDGPAS